MDNILNSGGVLPHGLLSSADDSGMRAFNRTFKNSALRVGIIIDRYDIDDDKNKTKLTPEYDVVTIEQDGSNSQTNHTYKNCPAVDGLGSIADFFEKTLRVQEKTTYKGEAERMKGQDGAIVLLLCLDAASNRGVIIGGFNHPDRTPTLKGDGAHLEGEFNGVNIVINDDGSCALTFNGQTDNQGNPTDKSQGVTTVSIEKDGSFQIMHDAITQRYDRKGKATLTTKDDATTNSQGSFVVSAGKDINLTATGNGNLSVAKLVAQASGDASFASQNFDIAAQSAVTVKGAQFKVEAQSMASVKAPQITMDGMVALGGQGGQPLLLMNAMILSTGNLGLPSIGQAISGFTTKVTAT